MSDFNLITTRIIPKFLEKTEYKYVVLGGKAYQYYFKDIRSDDWDIILDYDPNKFLEELMNELNRRMYDKFKYDDLNKNLVFVRKSEGKAPKQTLKDRMIKT